MIIKHENTVINTDLIYYLDKKDNEERIAIYPGIYYSSSSYLLMFNSSSLSFKHKEERDGLYDKIKRELFC